MLRWSVPLLAMILSSCGVQVPEVTPELVTAARARWPDADAPQLQRGRDVLTTTCTRCHAVRDPASHDEAGWQRYLDAMAPKAQLTAQQRADLERFLLASRGLSQR